MCSRSRKEPEWLEGMLRNTGGWTKTGHISGFGEGLRYTQPISADQTGKLWILTEVVSGCFGPLGILINLVKGVDAFGASL